MRTRRIVQLSFFSIISSLVFIFRRNVEAFCPFGAIETLHIYLTKGKMLCSLGVGNIVVLLFVLLLTLFFRRVFCGYICPIGALSEFVGYIARKMHFKQLRFSAKVERCLGAVKYFVFVLVVYFTAVKSSLVFRDYSPCATLISIDDDIKNTAYAAFAVFLVASFLVSLPFCRWLCPFAVVQNIVSRFGLTKIERDTDSCIDCGKCSRACPMNIDVAKIESVDSANCLSCFDCVSACPVGNTKSEKNNPLTWAFAGKKQIKRPNATALAAIILCAVGVALAVNFWDLDTFIYERDIAKPDRVERIVLEVAGLKCSGSASQCVYFLERDDFSQVGGYLKVSTSPRSGWVDVDVWFDPLRTNKETIIEAIVEPYYAQDEKRWRTSPFKIKGVDPLSW